MTKPSLHPFTWWIWAIGLAVAIVRFDSTWFTLSCLGVVMVVVYGLREDAPWAKSFDWTLKLAAWILAVRTLVGIAIGVPLSDSQPILALIIVNIGFACAGLGIGPMFPAYILAASEVPGIASSIAIARVGVIGIAGYFIGPSVTGALAQVLTLPVAMMYPVLMLLLAGYQSHIIKK